VPSLWSWLFIFLLIGVVPYLSARSLRAAGTSSLSRTELYASACFSLWLLAAVGYLVIRIDGDTAADVYLTRGTAGASWMALPMASLLLAAAGLLVFALSHIAHHALRLPMEEAMLRRLRPSNLSESLWILLAVSPTAGFCEEFLYRGFLISRLAPLLSSWNLAAILSAAAFGAAHLYQGWAGALRAALIALILSLPVIYYGSLIPSIIAHALIDAVGILCLWPLLERSWPRAAAE